MKKIWSALLIISLILTYILISPALEVYVGIPCPFGTFTDPTFTFFGLEFHGIEQQIGLMLVTAVLAKGPGLFACLCITKLQNLPKNPPPLVPKKKIVDSKLNIENKQMGLNNFEGVMEVRDEGTLLCSKKQMKRIHDDLSNHLNDCLL